MLKYMDYYQYMSWKSAVFFLFVLFEFFISIFLHSRQINEYFMNSYINFNLFVSGFMICFCNGISEWLFYYFNMHQNRIMHFLLKIIFSLRHLIYEAT